MQTCRRSCPLLQCPVTLLPPEEAAADLRDVPCRTLALRPVRSPVLSTPHPLLDDVRLLISQPVMMSSPCTTSSLPSLRSRLLPPSLPFLSEGRCSAGRRPTWCPSPTSTVSSRSSSRRRASRPEFPAPSVPEVTAPGQPALCHTVPRAPKRRGAPVQTAVGRTKARRVASVRSVPLPACFTRT